jgi:hypothetical protein
MRSFVRRQWHRHPRGVLLALATTAFVAALAAPALGAFLNLDARVDTDNAAGISPNKDAAALDAVGGATTAGAPNVPWTVFEKATSAHQQVFSRAFNGTAWVTKGHGTVGGRSSASPTFASSLNFDQNREGEAPAIDFAGAGRLHGEPVQPGRRCMSRRGEREGVLPLQRRRQGISQDLRQEVPIG